MSFFLPIFGFDPFPGTDRRSARAIREDAQAKQRELLIRLAFGDLFRARNAYQSALRYSDDPEMIEHCRAKVDEARLAFSEAVADINRRFPV